MVREGEKLNVQAEELCMGDIIEVKFGDRIPADVRVIEARGFKVSFWFLSTLLSKHSRFCGQHIQFMIWLISGKIRYKSITVIL